MCTRLCCNGVNLNEQKQRQKPRRRRNRPIKLKEQKQEQKQEPTSERRRHKTLLKSLVGHHFAHPEKAEQHSFEIRWDKKAPSGQTLRVISLVEDGHLSFQSSGYVQLGSSFDVVDNLKFVWEHHYAEEDGKMIKIDPPTVIWTAIPEVYYSPDYSAPLKDGAILRFKRMTKFNIPILRQLYNPELVKKFPLGFVDETLFFS